MYVCMACTLLLCATFLPPRTCVQRTEIVCWYQRCRLPLLGTRCSFLTTPSSIGTSSLGPNSFGMPSLSNNAHHAYHVSLLNAPIALNNILSACVQLQYGTVLASFNLFLCRTIPNAEHSCVGHFTSLLLNVRAFYCRMLDVSASVVHINPALPFHHTLYIRIHVCV